MDRFHSNTYSTLSYACKGFWLFGLMLMLSTPAAAQHPGKAETVKYINSLIGPANNLTLRTGMLVVTFRDDKDRLVREDRVPASDLDLNIFYEQESGLLCIPCMKDYRECLTRVLVFQKVKRRYERFSIPVADEMQYEKLKKAFDHLIRLLSEVKYRETVILD